MPETAKRYALQDGLPLRVRYSENIALALGSRQSSIDKPWSYRIDADLELSPLLSQRSRNAYIAHLGGGVVELARIPTNRSGREKIHHLAHLRYLTLCLDLVFGRIAHIGRCGSNTVKGPTEIDVEDEAPLLVAHTVGDAVSGDSCVIH